MGSLFFDGPVQAGFCADNRGRHIPVPNHCLGVANRNGPAPFKQEPSILQHERKALRIMNTVVPNMLRRP